MKRLCLVLFLLGWLVALGDPVSGPNKVRPKVVGYVQNGRDLDAFARGFDFAKVTHLNLAFENPTNATGDLSFQPRNAALLEAARRQRVPVLLSIGGGGAAEDPILKPRYFGLLREGQREGFVAKLVAYLDRHGFAGLDVDLEGPSINEDYGAFIADLGRALKPKGKLLTAALSKGYGGDRVPASALAHFDFVNVMAYDATGPWAPKSAGPHSSLKFAEENVAYWLGRGLPKSKLVLGVPFYGHGFGAAHRAGGYSYADILAAYPGAEKADEVGAIIWYNGLPTIRAKSRLVQEQGLAGVMIWALDHDVPGERSLLNAIDAVLNPVPAPAAK